MRIGIVGAGIAGLAASIRMACRGHEVEVFEANPFFGGKLFAFEEQGFHFDAGPSLFTMPDYVDELFRLAGEDPRAHFRYSRLPEVCRYFWNDDTFFRADADASEFAREAEETFGVPAGKVARLLEDARRKYELAGRIFLEKSLHLPKTWMSRDVLRALPHLASMGLFSSMDSLHRRSLGHGKLVQLFNRFATYNGSDPYRAPAMLSVIPHFEHHLGAWYPEGGMKSIPAALHDLARRKGVRIHLDAPVERILTGGGKATGLMVKGEELPFDRIISNVDVHFTYNKLLPGAKAPRRTLHQEKSTSALIFYWGISGSFPELGLHNIFFSDDYREEFRHLARGSISDDPTVYVNITGKYSPEHAPEGAENWFVMVNVPHDSGQDWPQLTHRLRRQVTRKLSRILDRPLEDLIKTESIMDPPLIERKTGSHLGALYGSSSNNRLAAFFRHPNFSRRIDRLYFCGGSVHPGGGIPLCLLSARIVDKIFA